MRGYCETCAQVVDSERAWGADVCPTCGDDVHPGVHIEEVHGIDPPEDDFDFDEWLLNG